MKSSVFGTVCRRPVCQPFYLVTWQSMRRSLVWKHSMSYDIEPETTRARVIHERLKWQETAWITSGDAIPSTGQICKREVWQRASDSQNLGQEILKRHQTTPLTCSDTSHGHWFPPILDGVGPAEFHSIMWGQPLFCSFRISTGTYGHVWHWGEMTCSCKSPFLREMLAPRVLLSISCFVSWVDNE